ncbi:hypothetical protein GIB67_032663 [Kingdonia uniflora]|uniref:Uncharacterized protein n=1 Tax=Kingdonia uniflora TaxID=39325 RepID=A0A7J7MW00_9MAGN|nr:hypothetical protein GIB67_032663 [Kingdonia uniflora]
MDRWFLLNRIVLERCNFPPRVSQQDKVTSYAVVNPNPPGIFLKAPEKFIIIDNLIVTPFSFISSLSFLEREKVPMGDIEVRVMNVGHEEALRLLEASLASGSVLSSAFNVKKN